MATVRYLVGDVERSIAFYTGALGFQLDQSMAPAFARVSRGDLVLWLAGPKSSAARAMPDGRRPEPGGWNRFVVEESDLESRVAELKRAGQRFRNEIVVGPGGKQILLEDPDEQQVAGTDAVDRRRARGGGVLVHPAVGAGVVPAAGRRHRSRPERLPTTATPACLHPLRSRALAGARPARAFDHSVQTFVVFTAASASVLVL